MNARLLHSVGAHGRQFSTDQDLPSGESPFRNSLENIDEHTQMIQNDQTKDLETLYLKLENSKYFFVKPQLKPYTDLNSLIGKTQCGNFRIFLQLRFYVKSS